MSDQTYSLPDAAIKARMRERLAALGWTLEALARRTETSRHNVRNWVNGDTRVPAHFLASFSAVVPVSKEWILTGEGLPEDVLAPVEELAMSVIRAVAYLASEPAIDPRQRRAHLNEILRLTNRAKGGLHGATDGERI